MTGQRRRTDLELTDAALEELERANLEVVAMTSKGTLKLLAPFREPSPAVRALMLGLQERYDKIRVGRLRNTLVAHDELLRLQGYLLSGGFDVWHRRPSGLTGRKAS